MTSSSPSKTGDDGPMGGSVGFGHHDHAACIRDTIAAAEARCAADGLRFTPVRRKVLELLLQEHRAVGAYAILDRLREDGFGSQPPVAYRALDFLVSNGLAHKIARLNAFIACAHPEQNHTPTFMICRKCDAIAETHSADTHGAIDAAARETGFQVEHTVVEVEGVCPTCTQGA